MALLSKQTRDSLFANLWRLKTVVIRNWKKAIIIEPAFWGVLIALIILYSQIKTQSFNISADSSITVTTNNPINSENYFYDTSLTTNFSLPNCSLNEHNVIGLVMSSSASFQEQTALQYIFDMLNQSYMSNNPSQSIPLSSKNFNDYSQLDSYLHSRNYIDQNNICFAFGFSEFDSLSYSFTFDQYFSWQLLGRKSNTNQTYIGNPYYFTQKFGKNNFASGFNAFNTSGFQQLMTLATASVIKSVDSTLDPNFAVAYLPMNTGPYSSTSNYTIQILLITIMMLGSSYARKLKSAIMQEKPEIESRVIGMLRLQGLTPSVEVLIYWVIDAVLLLPLGLFLAILAWFVTVKNVTFGLYLLLIWMYYIQINLLHSIMYYGFGQKGLSRLIFFCYSLLLILATALRFFHPNTSKKMMVMECFLFPNFQFLFFIQFANYKLLNPYVNSDVNITELSYQVRDMSFAEILLIGALNICIFTILMVYLWPLTIDVKEERKLRFYYPFTQSYWCQSEEQEQIKNEEPDSERGRLNQTIPLLSGQFENDLQLQERILVQEGKIEPLRGDESKERLVITELVKKFGNFTAVDQLSLTLFQDQILVLLGHNGAGKTTTIDVLTGMLKATSGAANAFGIDLLLGKASENLISVCPQHNVLLTKMTVFENLTFFCKNSGIENIDAKIFEMLNLFRMTEKKDSFPDQLSGGQKRKLQLMISLCTNAKIILLDEPSSGMDPSTRRETWQILKKIKSGKIVIMTTHYMDEAEQLGDRVAIMSQGKLKCCGTSLFLKNKYSHSFIIEITQADKQRQLTEFERILSTYIQKISAENGLHTSTDEQSRIVYTVPKEFGKQFSQFFAEIDQNLGALNIKEYCVRTSSLEEVFAQIGENEKIGMQNEIEINRISEFDSSQLRTELGEQSDLRTFQALVGLNLKTNLGKIIVLFVLSCVFALIPMIYVALANSKQPEIKLSSVSDVYKGASLPLQAYVNQNQQSIFANFEAEDINLQQLDFTAGSNITETLQSWANQIQNQANQSGATVYGSYYLANVPDSLQNCQQTETNNCQLAVAVYGNLTSISSQNVFGATVLSQIAKQYTNIPQLQIKFNNQATTNRGSPVSQFISNYVGYFTAATTVLVFLFVTQQITRIQNYYYMLILTKSGSKYLYIASLLLLLIIFHCALLAAFEGLEFFMLLLPQGLWLAGILFILTDSIFIFLLVYYFAVIKKKSVYLLIGILYPISFFVVASIAFTLFSEHLQQYRIGYIAILSFTFLPPVGFSGSFLAWWSRQSLAKAKNVAIETIGSYQIESWFMIATTFWFLFYSLLLTLLVTGKICRYKELQDLSPTEIEIEDPQVRQERERIKTENNTNEVVKCIELVKKYDGKDPNPQENQPNDRPVDLPISQAESREEAKKRAVDGVSFSVSQGECFALLGLSGAGKTSTLNMLMGLESIQGGKCSISNQDLKEIYNQPEKLHGLVGYCPQQNSIEENLTVRDSLWYLCEIIGVRKETVEDVVTNTMARFDLSDYANTKAGVLSGGNKRKLCCAQAMLGNPKSMFIDEVSAGVDPVARRKVWKAMRFEAANSALILTTHTMEEAEILATKIGIMVAGKFKCLGTFQSIQETYGNGFEIEMNLRLEDLHGKIEELDPDRQWSDSVEYIKLKLKAWQDMMTQTGKIIALDFADEFSRGGTLSILFEKAKNNEKIDLNSLQREIKVQNEVAIIVQDLTQSISIASIILFDGSYLVVRLEKKASLTYGQIYGFMEGLVDRLAIKEYSCKRATLEQIFNSFANEESLQVFNARVSIPRAKRAPTIQHN